MHKTQYQQNWVPTKPSTQNLVHKTQYRQNSVHKTHYRQNSVPTKLRLTTVQIFFSSVLIFDVGFRLFRFGSSNCILFVFHVQNIYSLTFTFKFVYFFNDKHETITKWCPENRNVPRRVTNFPVRMSVLTTFIVKKIEAWTEPKSGKDEPKPNHEFWTAGNRYFG